MKILFTGSTSKQTNDEAQSQARVKRIDDSSIICNSLRSQGFIVDRRNVKWGEDLSEYGLAIVGAGSFSSSTYSIRIFNAIYAMATAKKVLVFHEDWKIDNALRSYQSVITDEGWKKAMNKSWSNGDSFYGGIRDRYFEEKVAKQTIQKVIDGGFDAIIPAFDWGDKQLVRDIIKSKNIYNLDLTPYVLQNWDIPLNVECKPKQKKHMLASLVDHSSWVRKNKLKWPVDYFGAKSMKAPQLASETEVFHRCGDYWSILCPEYPHAGSGWFRVRWIYAAIWKSILLSSQKDLTALGLPKVDIESMGELELQAYAELQSKAVLKHMWTQEQFDKKIKDVVLSIEPNLTIQQWSVGPKSVVPSLESFFS